MRSRGIEHVAVCVEYTGEPDKTAELIEMPFGEQTEVGAKNHVLDVGYFGATWRIGLNHPFTA